MRIYISPHSDDVCFSIGHLVARHGGELMNVFTSSLYVAAPMRLPFDRDQRVAFVSELRKREDMRFAQAADLRRHDLGLAEPPVIGLDSFDLSGLDQEVEALSDRLIPYLIALLSTDGDPNTAALYCPMGIGGHRNHVSILLAVRDAYKALARLCTVWLYEDLHYASKPVARRQGLSFAKNAFVGAELSPTVLRLDPAAVERKLGWVGLYASQHGRPPRPEDFTPASGAEQSPHEMVWRVRASQGQA